MAGAIQTYDDEGSLGKGGAFGGGFGLRVTPRLDVQLEITRAHHERETSDGALRWEGTPWFVTGNALWRWLPGARVQPFVKGGIGRMHYPGSFQEGPPSNVVPPVLVPKDGVTPTRPTKLITYQDDAVAFLAGGGVAVLVGRHVAVRPEFKLFVSSPDRPEPLFSVFHGSVAAAVAW